MDSAALSDRVCKLETRLGRLVAALSLSLLALLVTTAFAWVRSSPPEALRLRTLSVVDENGVERVRLGGRLPDAIVDGKRVPRGEEVAGILLYDDTGQERSGYVTFSPSQNVALTLDTREGQVALFAADAHDGAVARLWHANGDDWVEMRSDSAGTRLTAGHAREIVFQQPPLSRAEAATACSALKDELRQLASQPPVEEVLRACKQRLPDGACRECLGVRPD